MVRIKFPINYSFLDYPNKEDVCVSIYFMGCEHKCKNCYNPQFINPNYKVGTILIDPVTLLQITKNELKRIKTNKVTLLGGDPLFNVEFIKKFLQLTSKEKIEICIYTGDEIREVKEKKIIGFKFIKTGAFYNHLSQISEKTDSHIQFASKNQQLYNNKLVLLSKDGKYNFKK
jgi:anaerobic ribonucleoside-triphosphate reductase activating protein